MGFGFRIPSHGEGLSRDILEFPDADPLRSAAVLAWPSRRIDTKGRYMVP